MRLVFKQIKVYARLVALVALALVVAAVVVKNTDNKVNVWFFKSYESVHVLWLILFTSVGSILAWWILTATIGVWRDVRQLHRATALDRAQKDQLQRAKELAAAEERLDRKLKQSAGDDEPAGRTQDRKAD